MKSAHAWKVIVAVIALSAAGACGGPSSTDEEASELRLDRGFSVSACCRRAYRPGWRRGHCIAEAMRGHGSCAHPGKHDAGACDAGPGGHGGAGGSGATDGGTDAPGGSGDGGPGDPAPACGNARIDPGEECDPPDGQTCDATCLRIPICGNGTLERGEECDPPHGSPPFPACDSSCHIIPPPSCLVVGSACDSTVPCCGGLRCLGGTCLCLAPGASCTAADTCCEGTCTNGSCAACVPFGTGCDASNPCCSGLVCSPPGICVNQQPTCMPDGALCSATSPCCSGAPCVGGLCGGACVLDGAACDGSNPCCKVGSTCTNGVCGGVACMALGQSCVGPGGLVCCSGSMCGGFGLCRSQGGSCSDVGAPCNVVGNGCCSGSTCGPNGKCIVVLGCYPPGQDCSTVGTPQCCSGICLGQGLGPRGRCL